MLHKIKTATSAKLDPIVVEIIRHSLQSIPDEIEADIMRTAYSPLVYEYKDYAVGLVDAQGRMIAQCKGGIPLFLANVLGRAVEDGLAIYGADQMEPGDVIMSNHAATFGQHLNNMIMYAPVFDPSGRLFGFMATLVHWSDVGGRYVGSSASNDSTDIFQEGFQLHTVKLHKRGERVEEIYRIIAANTRLPELVLGDLSAQLAGCIKGARLFEELVAKFGAATTASSFEVMWDQSEKAALEAVRDIPDGVYKGSSFLDNDGVDLNKTIPIDITVRIEGERFIVDFSEVGDQVHGPFNSGRFGGGISAARIAFKYLTTPNELINEGSFRPLEVILPDGKFLSASSTAALARYSTPLPTVIDTIMQALAHAAPDRVAAGHYAGVGSHRIQGISPRTGRLFSHIDTVHGGWGGSRNQDGPGPFKTMMHGDTLDVPIEVQEGLFGLHADYYQFRPDSAGAGEHRGGLGLDKVYTVKHSAKVTVTFERFGCPSWGLLGGAAGEPGYAEILRKGADRPGRYQKECDVPLEPGDKLIIHSGGGGGFGLPFERAPQAVADDVLRGYVTRRAALETYGVVLDEKGQIDPAATANERKRPQGGKP